MMSNARFLGIVGVYAGFWGVMKSEHWLYVPCVALMLASYAIDFAARAASVKSAGCSAVSSALPSFQSGCSRHRESSWWRRRAGLPMLMREVLLPRGTFGLAPPGS